MSEKKAEKKYNKTGFSFEPEIIGSDPEGKHIILDANHYIMLGSASQGQVFYCPKENKYYAGEGSQPINEKRFKEHFLPYLRWDHDQLVEITVPGTDKNGKAATLPTGCYRSEFPPTPENISAKRAELIQAAVSRSETPDMAEIYASTAPRELLSNEKFMAELDDAPADIRLARRINKAL